MESTEANAQARALLKKYQAGQCTPSEQQQVLNWYYSFTQQDDLVISNAQQRKNSKKIKHNILVAIAVNKGSHSPLVRLLNPLMRIAAILAIVIATGILIYQYTSQQSIPIEYSKISTLAGQRKMVVLSDGSKIWLNNKSSLTYPKVFAKENRTVSLQGEAFFEVVHNSKKPFIIHAQKLRVQVLGTTFNVKAFSGEKRHTVTLASGKVSVSLPGQHQALMLLPGEQAIYDLRENKLLMAAADVEHNTAWRNGVLSFRYTNLEEICRELERWYDVKITIKNKKLLHQRYTLKQRNESLNNVMKVLSAGEFDYQINSGTVTIW